MKNTRKCVECNKPFQTEVGNKRVCSRECRLVRRRRLSRKRAGQTVNCAVCGQAFEYSVRWKVVCSVECRAERKRQLKHRAPTSKREGVACGACQRVLTGSSLVDGLCGNCRREDSVDWSAVIERVRTSHGERTARLLAEAVAERQQRHGKESIRVTT